MLRDVKRRYFGYLWDAWETSMEQKKVFWKLRVKRVWRLLMVTGLEEPLEYLRSVNPNRCQWAARHLFGPFFWIVEET